MHFNTRPKRFWRNWQYSERYRPAFRRVRAVRRAKRGVLTQRELRDILQTINEKAAKG